MNKMTPNFWLKIFRQKYYLTHEKIWYLQGSYHKTYFLRENASQKKL